MTDTFFTQDKCDRCGGELKSRIMSWFTEETLCNHCSHKEKELRSKLEEKGVDTRKLEGCGYVPKLDQQR